MKLGFSKLTKSIFVLLGCVYLVCLYLSIEFVSSLYIDSALSSTRENAQQKVALLASNIESMLYRDIHVADGIDALAAFEPEFVVENWSFIVSKLLTRTSFVTSVAIYPDDVIEKVYPDKESDLLIGLDFRTIPDQYKTVLQARMNKDIYLAGPISLIEGGSGLIARTPIFSDFPKNQKYWGGLAIVIDYNALIDTIDLTTIEGTDIAIRRARAETLDANAGVFYGDVETFTTPDTVIPINLPGTKWELAAKIDFQHFHSVQRVRNIIRSLGWVLGLFLLLSLIFILRYINYTRIASLQDELTALPNRRYALNQLEQLVQKPQGQRTFAILNIDLNDFKQINDNYGHAVGDLFLKHIAKGLRDAFRESDVVSRLGGDEFLIIVYRCDNFKQASKICDNLRRKMKANAFEHKTNKIYPSLSIGVALGKQHAQLKDMLKFADKAMYLNKKEIASSQPS